MTGRTVPRRPGAATAQQTPRRFAKRPLDPPLRAFPSSFLRVVECDRCGKVQMVNQVHQKWGKALVRDILDRLRNQDCGGRPGKAE